MNLFLLCGPFDLGSRNSHKETEAQSPKWLLSASTVARSRVLQRSHVSVNLSHGWYPENYICYIYSAPTLMLI